MATIGVSVPDPGESEEIEILALRAAVGDTVTEGQIVVEVATDKVNVDVEAPVAGRVVSVLVSVGEFVAPDAVLLEIDGG